MRFGSDIRWLDATIKAVVVLLIASLGYLAYAITAFQIQERRGQPVSRAIENLVAAVSENPDDLSLRLLLADAFAAAGRLRDAVEQYNAALEISPDNPTALTGLALVSMYQQEWETAEEYWLAVIDGLAGDDYSLLDQRLEVAYYQLGVTYIEMTRYEDAIAHLREALRIKRSAADTHYALSVAYGRLDSESNQRGYLENALMFDPRMPEANYDLGLLLLAEGDIAAAAEHFRASADNAPESRREPRTELDRIEREGSAEVRLERARELQDSDAASALSEARIAFALDPSLSDASRLAARLWEETGDEEQALDMWRKVLEADPNDGDAAAAIDRLTE